MKSKMKPAFLLVIQSGASEYFKITSSIDPEKQLARLQSGNPFTLFIVRKFEIPDYIIETIEQFIRYQMVEYKFREDWFRLDPNFLDNALHKSFTNYAIKWKIEHDHKLEVERLMQLWKVKL